MQLKFHRQKSIGQSIGRMILKILVVLIFIICAIFFLDKINFSSPNKDIQKDVTNEIIKLK